MSRHDQRGGGRFIPSPFVCSHCEEGACNRCIDVMRAVYSQDAICHCKRPGHDGEPVNQQILDPETGVVHAPGLTVDPDGTVRKNDE